MVCVNDNLSVSITALQQRTGSAIGGLAFGLSLCLLASGKAEAAAFFTFTKIADTSTFIPEGTGNFTSFGNPALDNETVGFRGFGASQEGLYTNVSDSLNVLADRNTAIPDRTGNFTSFSDPTLDNGTVAFSAGFQGGIYTNPGGSLQVVADRNTPVPGGGNSLLYFYPPSLDNGNVAFKAEYTVSGPARPLQGIFTDVGGELRRVAEYYPGPRPSNPCNGGPFTGLGNPSVDDGIVAFAASNYCSSYSDSPRQAILTTTGDRSLNVVIDSNTAIPGGTGNFTRFGDPTLDNANVAFRGFGSSQQGIYTIIDDSLQLVADLNTAIPSSSGNFTDFGNPVLNDGNVVFVGFDSSSQQGIYTTIGGSLTKMLATNDSLDGKIISSLSLGSDALNKLQIAFLAGFSDGTSGIYVATDPPIPDPTFVPESSSTLGLLGIGALGAGAMLRRKQKSVSSQ